jgi:hypothetical protein
VQFQFSTSQYEARREVNTVAAEACKDKGSGLGLGAQKNIRGQPVKISGVITVGLPL